MGLNAFLEEVFSGIKIVKGFGREAYEGRRFQHRNAEYYRLLRMMIRTEELSAPVLNVLAPWELLGWCFMAASRLSLAPPRLARFFLFDGHYYAL